MLLLTFNKRLKLWYSILQSCSDDIILTESWWSRKLAILLAIRSVLWSCFLFRGQCGHGKGGILAKSC